MVEPIVNVEPIVEDVLASDLVDDPNRIPAVEPIRARVTARRRREWGRQATLAAVGLGALGVFLAVTRTIRGPRASGFDRAIVSTFGRARRPLGSALFRGVTFFGSAHAATVIALGAVAASRRTPRLAWQIVSGALAGVSAELVLKRLFRRQRPTILEHLERVRSTSFPSGHAMASASLYLTLAFVASRSRRLRTHRAKLLGGAGTIATAIAASRVYLGVHWPTDVIGGLALGTAWACANEAAFDFSGADRVEREAGLGP